MFDFENVFYMLKLYEYFSVELYIIFIGILSFIVSYLVIPRIISIVKTKKLMDDPNKRSSHKESTPTMGGIAFFASFLFCLFFMKEYDVDGVEMALVLGLLMLFYIGLKDDLVGVQPKTKILGQLLSGSLIMVSPELRLLSFSGFLGIQELPIWFSFLIGAFVVVVIVNSYNLIDGINGLASMVGVVVFSIFGSIFYFTEHYYYVLLCIAAIGCLLAFLRYNISKKTKYNIFMGDTGSMMIGFVIAVCTLKFLNLSEGDLVKINIQSNSKFIIIIAILFILFADTTRVFVIRTIKNGKPFFADRNHMHHVIIDYMKLSHIQASLLLALLNLIVFGFIYFLNEKVSDFILFLVLFSLVIGVTLFLFYHNRSYPVKKQKQKIRKILNHIRRIERRQPEHKMFGNYQY